MISRSIALNKGCNIFSSFFGFKYPQYLVLLCWGVILQSTKHFFCVIYKREFSILENGRLWSLENTLSVGMVGKLCTWIFSYCCLASGSALVLHVAINSVWHKEVASYRVFKKKTILHSSCDYWIGNAVFRMFPFIVKHPTWIHRGLIIWWKPVPFHNFMMKKCDK